MGVAIAKPMLGKALRLGGPQYMAGDALSLPNVDRSFNLAAMTTTLEFVSDPACALAEESEP